MNYRWKFFEAQPRFDMTHDECLRIWTRREKVMGNSMKVSTHVKYEKQKNKNIMI